MARNIEIKARIADLDLIEAHVRTLADSGPIDLSQDDTFFASTAGRLKLRELASDHGELIYYHRPDVSGPKLSNYLIAPTTEPGILRHILSQTLAVIGRVRKQRRVYFVANTRIHLDRVEGLGTFLELEVVLSDSQPVEEGETIARGLLSRLGIADTDLVSCAYIDLLAPDVSSYVNHRA